MATTTARLGLRKPAGTDNVAVGTDLDNNFDAIDNVVGFTACTSTTRPSTPFQGQGIYETDTKRTLVSNGSVPASASWEQNGFAAILPCTSTTRPAVVFPGLVIRESDTGSYYLSNGSAPASASWVSVVSVEGPATVGLVGASAPLRIQTTSTLATNRLLDGRKQGDANPAITLDFDGKIQWGPGGASVSDAILYRNGVGTLRTDTNLSVGGNLSVSGVGAVLTAYKTTDLTVTNSTVLVSDAQLVVPVVANATYAFESCLIYSATTVAKAAMAVAGPAGATGLISPRTIDLSVTAYFGPIEVSMAGLGGAWGSGTIGAGSKVTALATGTISTAGTAGNVQVQFCQNVAEASNAVLHTLSWIKLTRLA